MTKTGHVATITQLEHEIKQNVVKNNTVNIVDNDYDRQKCEIVQEDLLNNNEIKGVVLCDSKYDLVLDSNGRPTGTVVADIPPAQAEKYKYFGFEFDSKLKWDNIIGIVIIHLLFVYTMVCSHPLPRMYQTYLWGKYAFILSTQFPFIIHQSAYLPLTRPDLDLIYFEFCRSPAFGLRWPIRAYNSNGQTHAHSHAGCNANILSPIVRPNISHFLIKNVNYL